jgi:hypothetical protein
MRHPIRWSLTCGLVFLAAALTGAETPCAFRQVTSVAVEDFSWVRRELAKPPVLKSAKPRYTLWALGDGRSSVMAMVWDESGGTGTGYDTFYFDRNGNGDLTEEGERFTTELKEGATFEVQGIRETGGPRVFTIRYVREKDNFGWQSQFRMQSPGGVGYEVGLLPGNLKIRWAENLKDAPVYRFGGPAVVLVNDKLPGEALGRWTAGDTAQLSTAVGLFGNERANQLRFYHSQAPGDAPVFFLRVAKDGQVLEDIPFTGGPS